VLTGTAAGLRLVGVSGEGRDGSSADTATTVASEERSEVVVRIGVTPELPTDGPRLASEVLTTLAGETRRAEAAGPGA